MSVCYSNLVVYLVVAWIPTQRSQRNDLHITITYSIYYPPKEKHIQWSTYINYRDTVHEIKLQVCHYMINISICIYKNQSIIFFTHIKYCLHYNLNQNKLITYEYISIWHTAQLENWALSCALQCKYLFFIYFPVTNHWYIFVLRYASKVPFNQEYSQQRNRRGYP